MYGDNVNMSWAYTYCHRLEYAPSYIKSAPNMEGCFMDCHNIKTPIVANDTINFFACYARCFNLEYSCMSDSVKNAGQAFCNCYNISNFCFGNNLVDCREMYYNAGRDFGGTFPEVFIYAENISNAVNCFYGAGKTYSGGSSRIVIYLLADTVTNNSFNYSIINSSLTINTNNNCRYNSSRNVYIYWKSLDEMKQLDINN